MDFRNLLLLLVLVLVAFFAWEKFATSRQPEPTPTPTPTPTPAPTPTPTPTPIPTPVARLTPEGVFIVIKRFTAQIPGGLHGFLPGKEVRLVKEEDGFLVVSDGVAEGRAPRDYFTNDLDKADGITKEIRATQQHYAAQLDRQQKLDNATNEGLASRQKSLELARLEERLTKLRIREEELVFADEQLRVKILKKGRFEGLTDLWKLSEQSQLAIAQNKEDQFKLDATLERLRAEVERLNAEARVLQD